jgi:hypothetical protein
MKSISWVEFTKLVNSTEYQEGSAESDEGRSGGEYGGPIGSLAANENGVSVTVCPCAMPRGSAWLVKFPEDHLISSFSYDGVATPSVSSEGVISYYVYLVGRVKIYPKDHPRTALHKSHLSSAAAA